MKAACLLIFSILLLRRDLPPFGQRAGDQIESLDISPDDRKILLLSNHDGTATSVFEVNIDGRSPRLILRPPNDGTFSRPRYSPDGKKIVFIKHFTKSFWESTVFICNSDGTDVQELTHGGELVTEAIFSGNDNVLYCSSKQYNSLKKKGTTDSRGFDIYSINVIDRQASKLSKLDAVGIDNLSEINEKYILFHSNDGKKSGIYSFEKDNPTRVLRMFPVNGTHDSSLLDKPGYAPDKFLLFTALSELYAMNLITHEANLIYDAKGGHLIQMLRGFHSKSAALFKKFDEPKLVFLNTDGTEVRSIDVEFPK